MIGRKCLSNVMNCKNRICFCVEYLNISEAKHIEIYSECYKIKRGINKLENIVSPKMKQYINKSYISYIS